MLKNKTMTYISLFSSAGVGCYGFHMEGFECVATNELLPRRMDVQRVNKKCQLDSGYIPGDITQPAIKQRIFNDTVPDKEHTGWTDSLGLTPLHYSILLGKEEIVAQLLQNGTWKMSVASTSKDVSALLDYTTVACLANLPNRVDVFRNTSPLVIAQLRSKKALEKKLWLKKRKLDIQDAAAKQANGIPAIVPQDLFDRVQEKIKKNKKAPARAKAEVDYLLTIKLFCGHCGAYMCGESGKGRSGKTYHYYKCVSVKKKRTDCKKKAIKKDFIEEFVVRHTMKMLTDDKAIEAIIAMLMDLQERENVNLPLYEQQLRDVERNIENFLDAIQQGIFTKSTKARLDELEAAKEDLEIRIANEKIAKPKLTEDKIKHFLHRFRVLDMSKEKNRRILIDMFINRIYLYDDKLVITFNHKDGAETITLEDIETALAEAGFGSDLVSFAVTIQIRTDFTPCDLAQI